MIEALTVYAVTAALVALYSIRMAEDNNWKDVAICIACACVYPLFLLEGIINGDD